jgi:BolA family transcriptional regulator, general stress-responsive regulator
MSARGPIATSIEAKLRAALSPMDLTIDDESARHAGHVGARQGGGSHFRVRIVSEKFNSLSRVERQRLVYAALAEEIAAGVHALALTTLTPEESRR